MAKMGIKEYKGYMPAVGLLAAIYNVYSHKTNGFGQLWTDLQNMFRNPAALWTKIKTNMQYIIAAIAIFIITPIIVRKVSNQYAKMLISLAGNFTGSYLILKYVVDPPEEGVMGSSMGTLSVAPQYTQWSTGYSAINRGTPVMGMVPNTYGGNARKY